MKSFDTPDQFKSRPALLIMAIVGLAFAYLLGSRAIDTGSYWQYLGTTILVILSLRLTYRSVKPKK